MIPGVALLFASAAASGRGTAKPSILQIVADDLGYNDVWDGNNNFEDNPNVHTPYMTELFKDAVRLTSYYTSVRAPRSTHARPASGVCGCRVYVVEYTRGDVWEGGPFGSERRLQTLPLMHI
jgi:hypothetical protein